MEIINVDQSANKIWQIMRKAFTFFTVAVVVFLWKTNFGALSGNTAIVSNAGLIALAGGIFALFLVHSYPLLRLFFLPINLVFWTIISLIYIIVFIFVLCLCIVELSFPILVGLGLGFVLFNNAISLFWSTLVGIGFLAVLIWVGRPLSNLIKNTWNTGLDSMESLPQVSAFDDWINKITKEMHHWLAGKNEN